MKEENWNHSHYSLLPELNVFQISRVMYAWSDSSILKNYSYAKCILIKSISISLIDYLNVLGFQFYMCITPQFCKFYTSWTYNKMGDERFWWCKSKTALRMLDIKCHFFLWHTVFFGPIPTFSSHCTNLFMWNVGVGWGEYILDFKPLLN